MFYLIGIGLKPKHLTLEALEALKNCDELFIDSYTSVFSEGSLDELKKILGKEITELNRTQIETDYEDFLMKAKDKNVALLIIGNALTATTHTQILLEANQLMVPFKVLLGVSVFDGVLKSFLSPYNFGRILSIVFWQKNYKPESFYDKIKENYDSKMHSLCLLDIQKDDKKEKLMNALEALETLAEISENKKQKWIYSTQIVVMSKLGGKDEKVLHGTMIELLNDKEKLKECKPACIVICTDLNDKEEEALSELHGKQKK